MSSLIRLLLIEDDPEHADLIRGHVARRHGGSVEFSWVKRLGEGLERLTAEPFDVILLDLGLPDSTIDQTLGAVLPAAKGIPVVVLSSLEDEDFAIKAVHQGAQDYLCKSLLSGELLFRAVRYSIERKAAEEALRAANRAKDEFLATLSHELRTPVSIIHGYAELATQGFLAEAERQKALETILRQAKLQVSLIDDLLDMSRIITGKLMLQKQAVELGTIVDAAIDGVRLAAESKHVSLRRSRETPGGLVHGDPIRIQQILWNLLSNAIKFTPPGGLIEVRLRRDQSLVLIEVEDSGEGIDPGFLPYVFDRFRQQDSSSSRRAGGLGLGLSIVRYLVELHGGQVSVTSAGIGKGATFSVHLPVMVVDSEASLHDSGATAGDVSGANPPTPAGNLAPLKGVHVLAIDDSPDALTLVGVALRRNGAVVSTARSSAEALGVLTTLNANVIVCDIGMPDENGIAFIRKLRSVETKAGRRHLPAAALSAYTGEEDRQVAFGAGFQAYLAKPVEETSLVNAVASLAGLEVPTQSPIVTL